MVGNLFPQGIRELEVKLVGGGAIPARIGGPLGDFCKGGTIPARKLFTRGIRGDGGTIPAGQLRSYLKKTAEGW